MMQALRFHGQKDLRVDKVPIPTCGNGQVKIKPSYAGICGTDLHEYLGGARIIPKTPHPLTQEKLPVTLGHEFSGIVEEVGPDVEDIKPGARVAVRPILYDGTCLSCREGLINCCDRNGFIGLSGWGGGMSEHVIVPRYAVFPVPESMPLEIAALIEPLAVAWHSITLSSFSPSKHPTVLILGTGPIGLSLILCLRARGCKNIIVSEPSTARAGQAKKFGAHHVLNPLTEKVPDRVKEICASDAGDSSPATAGAAAAEEGGEAKAKAAGVHIAYDAAGSQPGLDDAVASVRARGLVVGIAVWEGRASVVPNWFAFRERSYIGVATYQAGDFEAVIEAIQDGRIVRPGDMITRVVEGMERVEEEGFRALAEERERHVKILVKIS